MNPPIGTIVSYWKGAREGEPSGVARTRTEVQDIPSQKDVVWIKGVAGCISMTHVEAVEPRTMRWALFISRELGDENGVGETKLKAKCVWEHMSRTAVLMEWGDPREWP